MDNQTRSNLEVRLKEIELEERDLLAQIDSEEMETLDFEGEKQSVLADLREELIALKTEREDILKKLS